MPAAVGVDPALGKARDLACAFFRLRPGQGEAEPFGDDGRVDLHIAILEFDRFHVTHPVAPCRASTALRDDRGAGVELTRLRVIPGRCGASNPESIGPRNVWIVGFPGAQLRT